MNIPFSSEDEVRGGELFAAGYVKNIIFSSSTYQVAVFDPAIGKDVWVMLQLNNHNEITDYFCTCPAAEKQASCPHLSAARMRIFLDQPLPLHERYQQSFWLAIFRVVARHVGIDMRHFVIEEGAVLGYDSQHNLSFKYSAVHDLGREKVEEFFPNGRKEREDQSFKISGLSVSEISAYQAGHPSEQTRFELSFWSDLAKWIMNLFELGQLEVIRVREPSLCLPKWIDLEFFPCKISLAIEKGDWPAIIPFLSSISFPIKVYEFGNLDVKKLDYDPEAKCFHLDVVDLPLAECGHRELQEDFEEWVYIAGVGFIAKEQHPLLMQKTIPQEQIHRFLEQCPDIIHRFLYHYTYHSSGCSVQYTLWISSTGDLHIESYLFDKGDLLLPQSMHYPPWVFIANKGFYRLNKMKFSDFVTVIPKREVPFFIEKHRLWIAQYEGFQMHIARFETKMTYTIEKEELVLESEQESLQERETIIDFGSWVYIQHQGFYVKGVGDEQNALQPCRIVKEDISDFIDRQHDELEQVPGFFSHHCPVIDSGLFLHADQKGCVMVEPKFHFDREDVRVFGHYVYSPGEGFSLIPDQWKIPKKYTLPSSIPPDEQTYFFKNELKRLAPYIASTDDCLQLPQQLTLHLLAVERGVNKNQWKMQFAYVSEWGMCLVKDLWEAIHNFQIRLFSGAGRIELKDRKFSWLNRLSRNTIDIESNTVTLTTMEWVQLQILEDVSLAAECQHADAQFFSLLMGKETLPPCELPDLRGLKTTLRPYQKLGVSWLWFLYTYGLSGFLCDEMGLGKTHQAMALIAAVMNARESHRPKFLVVCPTSVIYHWEELLRAFLRKAKVVMYHGTKRRKKDLILKRDIILTSYGILRSDQELLSRQQFEVAVFDEIHVAKNQRSLINRALRSVDASVRIGLTGTPIENQLSELKSLFHIVVPHYLPVDSKFREEFVFPIERHNDQEKQKLLGQLIRPFILRRKKSDVLEDLPEKIEEVVYVDLSEEQRRLYIDTYENAKGLVEQDPSGISSSQFYLHVFALINRLKQICDHPALVLNNPESFEQHASGKWDYFVELLDEVRASGQKLVVFSQYLDMLAIIEMYLNKRGIGWAGIKGSTRDRKEELRKFKEDPKCEVFLGSLLAAGVGIDLVSASVVIHYDRWWNPAKENQATDRVHRIGQNRGVSVFKFVCKATIEEHIHHLITKKQGLLQNIVGYDLDEEIKRIDRDELVQLLKLIKQDVY